MSGLICNKVYKQNFIKKKTTSIRIPLKITKCHKPHTHNRTIRWFLSSILQKLLGLLHAKRNKPMVKAQSCCSFVKIIAYHSSLYYSKPLHTITKQLKTIPKRSVFHQILYIFLSKHTYQYHSFCTIYFFLHNCNS